MIVDSFASPLTLLDPDWADVFFSINICWPQFRIFELGAKWFKQQRSVVCRAADGGREGGEERSWLVEARHWVDSAILLPVPPNLDKFHCLPSNLCRPKISLFTPQFGKTIWTHAFVPFKLWEALPTIWSNISKSVLQEEKSPDNLPQCDKRVLNYTTVQHMQERHDGIFMIDGPQYRFPCTHYHRSLLTCKYCHWRFKIFSWICEISGWNRHKIKVSTLLKMSLERNDVSLVKTLWE